MKTDKFHSIVLVIFIFRTALVSADEILPLASREDMDAFAHAISEKKDSGLRSSGTSMQKKMRQEMSSLITKERTRLKTQEKPDMIEGHQNTDLASPSSPRGEEDIPARALTVFPEKESVESP